MNLKIRRALFTDAQAIIDYCNTVGGESNNLTFGKNQFGLKLEEEEEYLSSLEKSKNSFMLIGIIDGEIISLATVTGEKRKRVMHNVEIGISVLQKFQRQGIGTKILKQLIEECEQNKVIENIFLTVLIDNVEAQRLYSNNGFEEVGIKYNYLNINNEYKDVLVMQLKV